MKLFATDLDRTLIYSERALEEMETPLDNSMIAVEEKNGQKISYMTKHSFQLLKAVATQHLVVPVTTRTYDQYKRVFIFEKDIPITYVVTSNGAKIHYNGKLLKEWEDVLKDRLEKQSINMESLLHKLEFFNIQGDLRIADNLFFYFVLQKNLTAQQKTNLSKLASEAGWKLSLQGRKLYFMPLPICKGEAVKYIINREKIEVSAGAGDSLLDFPFLDVCDYPYIPSHGEIVKEDLLNARHLLSKGKGAIAGEDILKAVHQQFMN